MQKHSLELLFIITIESLLYAGAATIFGLWRFGSSLESCVDDVLALDGSRMQRELADMYVPFATF